jgi:DNA polymerase (family 10)
MDNQQIANTFQEIGDLLEIDGANHFRVLAYQNAAENIRGLGRELIEIWRENPEELENLPGIGEDLRLKIEEMLTTGVCQFHLKLLKKYGRGLLDVLAVRSIGPKKAALFYHSLKIDSLDKLKQAALGHKLCQLPRMGEKSETEILRAIEEHAKYSHRMLLSEALPLAEKIVAHLQKLKEVAQVAYAGSLRRRKETVGDLDILAAPHRPADASVIIAHFQKFPLVKNVIASGPTKCSVILESGAQSDLRVVEERSFGAALHYFTGSKDHNIEIRSHAQKVGKKVNEYGIFDVSGKDKNGHPVEKFIVGDSEKNFYRAVGLPWIPPTLRETRGEFQAAINGELPVPVELADLTADLNVNSPAGEGDSSLSELLQAARAHKLSCLAIADTFNSKELPTRFTATELTRQLDEIEELNQQSRPLKTPSPGHPLLLKALKLSINTDGTLDLPPTPLLNRLDFIIVKINHSFNLTGPRQTARLIKALSAHPKIKMLSCPNSRLLNEREAIAVNINQVVEHCARHGQFLEINSQPNRLDLTDIQIKIAVEKKAGLCINSDARSVKEFDFLQYGVWTAQRGWAEKKNILNAQPPEKILRQLL